MKKVILKYLLKDICDGLFLRIKMKDFKRMKLTILAITKFNKRERSEVTTIFLVSKHNWLNFSWFSCGNFTWVTNQRLSFAFNMDDQFICIKFLPTFAFLVINLIAPLVNLSFHLIGRSQLTKFFHILSWEYFFAITKLFMNNQLFMFYYYLCLLMNLNG